MFRVVTFYIFLGLYFDQVEVQPFIQGTFRFNEKNEKVGLINVTFYIYLNL